MSHRSPDHVSPDHVSTDQEGDAQPADFQPSLPAAVVDRRLRAASRAYDAAERNVVVWFAEMQRRHLHRDLGYASLRQYALQALGWSARRTADIARVAARLDDLPRIGRAVAGGELGYTKAREVIKVASPETEDAWLEEARQSSRRELERKVQHVLGRARPVQAARAEQTSQPELPTAPRVRIDVGREPDDAGGSDGPDGPDGLREPGGPGDPGPGDDPITRPPELDALAAAVPTTLGFRFSAVQRARWDALCRRLGRDPTTDDLLAALDALVSEEITDGIAGEAAEDVAAEDVAGEATAEVAGEVAGTATGAATEPAADHAPAVPSSAPADGRDDRLADGATGRRTAMCPRGHGPPIQIHVHQCPTCEAMETAGRTLDRPDRERVRCDAAVVAPGGRNTATIPPRMRREVLARDRHRCQTPGCHHTRFLEIHHLVPRARGGANHPDNLVTLCSACHRLWHEHGAPPWFLARLTAAGHAPPRRDTVSEPPAQGAPTGVRQRASP